MSIPLHDLSPVSSIHRQSNTEREGDSDGQDVAGLTSHGPEMSSQSPRQPLHTRTFADSWVFEILCWLLALCFLVVILVVLRIFNNQPLRNWNSGLTLNTLISIASQVAQTAVFVPVASSISQLKWIWCGKNRAIGDMVGFDDASRGPISSLILILKHPMWTLVYLGAINTSLILLLGPFAQQSLSLPLRQLNESLASGSMPIATQYQGFSALESIPNDNGELTFNTVVPIMRSAVTNGLLSTDITLSDVRGFCSTGNCTFEDYSSLAVCSSVDDVTPSIVEHCREGRYVTNTGCTYSVPQLQQSPTWRQDNFTTHDGSPTLWIGASQANPSGFPSGPMTLVDFYVLYFPDISVFSLDFTGNLTASLVALKGSLDLCVKTYRTTITNGVTSTYLVDSQTNLDWHNITQTLGTNSFTAVSATDANGIEFWMDQNTRDAFNSYLAAATFFGDITASQDPNTPNIDTVDGSSDAASAIGSTLYSGNLKGIEGLQSLLVNVETSMSNALRTTSNIPTNASGTANYNQVFISVDFRWLIVPILSIALALILLIAVMVETRAKHIPIWKDDMLAALFAIEPETRTRMEQLDIASLKDVPVVLEREGNRGWQLRGPAEPGWWAQRLKLGI